MAPPASQSGVAHRDLFRIKPIFKWTVLGRLYEPGDIRLHYIDRKFAELSIFRVYSALRALPGALSEKLHLLSGLLRLIHICRKSVP